MSQQSAKKAVKFIYHIRSRAHNYAGQIIVAEEKEAEAATR